jgi:hypothetical protein
MKIEQLRSAPIDADQWSPQSERDERKEQAQGRVKTRKRLEGERTEAGIDIPASICKLRSVCLFRFATPHRASILGERWQNVRLLHRRTMTASNGRAGDPILPQCVSHSDGPPGRAEWDLAAR